MKYYSELSVITFPQWTPWQVIQLIPLGKNIQ